LWLVLVQYQLTGQPDEYVAYVIHIYMYDISV